MVGCGVERDTKGDVVNVFHVVLEIFGVVSVINQPTLWLAGTGTKSTGLLGHADTSVDRRRRHRADALRLRSGH